MKILITLLIVFNFSFSFAKNDENKTCDESLKFETLLPPHQGFHYRGFLGNQPARTDDMESQMLEKGISRWGLRIYILPNLDLAKKFDDYSENQDLLMKGVYLIDPEMNVSEALKLYNSFTSENESQNDKNLKQKKQLASELFINSLNKNGMWYFEGGVAVQAPKDLVQKIFTPDQLELMETEDSIKMPVESEIVGTAFLYQRGWFHTKVVGVLKTQDFIDRHALGPNSSKRFMKIRQKARSLMEKQGWKVTLNTNLEALIDLTNKQVRKGQGDSSNRFTDEDYNNFRKAFKEGNLFTIEVWDGEGNAIAGTYGYRTGNVFHPETLVYTQGIDVANFTLMALIERLHQSGISFLNVGMVTPNTANLGGIYIDREEYEELKRSLPSERISVDLTSPWEPYPQWLKDLRGLN